MKNKYLLLIKKLLFACLFTFAFYGGNVYSHDTSTIYFQIDSLNIYNSVVDYMEIDATLGKNFYQVSGLLGFTDNNFVLLTGTGYGLGDGNGYLVDGRITLDYVRILLNKDGNGTITYYSVGNDGKLFIMDSASIAMLGIK